MSVTDPLDEKNDYKLELDEKSRAPSFTNHRLKKMKSYDRVRSHSGASKIIFVWEGLIVVDHCHYEAHLPTAVQFTTRFGSEAFPS